MSEDVRAATAPTTPTGRYRLRTHDLAPVLLPRARATSSPTALCTEREDLNAELPAIARPRRSLARVSTPHQGRSVLESIAFDPFSDSESFRLLLQSPQASSAHREDPQAVSEFGQWLLQRFPQLVRTFRALRMLNNEAATPRSVSIPEASVVHNEPIANQSSGRLDETEEDEANDAQDEQEADCDEAWRLIFRYATVLSATPGETIATQGITRIDSVCFLLNGHCELSFLPVLLRDCSTPSTPSGLPRMPGSGVGCSDRTTVQLRELVVGDCFGLDSAAFGFDYHLSTATAGSARQRNFLGLREATLTYVLCLPYPVVQQLQLLQHRQQDGSVRLPVAFPYSFAPEAEVFLRNTFLFRAMADSSRRFLAAHMNPVVVEHQEYLFTPGQSVRVFIVITGQLTLVAPREERARGRQEADLELELLQAHDSVGLAEVLRLTTSFERYCAVTSASGARAYTLPSTVLLMVLAQESSSLKLIHEWIAHRKSWFELRRATALAQRKKLIAEGCEPVIRLTLAAQRRSKLTCSHCGWTGHVSTSSSCVRMNIPVSESATSSTPQLDKRGRSREGSRAARQQARMSQSQRRSQTSEVIPGPHDQLFPTSPTSPMSPANSAKTPARRRLQVDSTALRALQISRVFMVARHESDELTERDADTREEQPANSRDDSIKSSKRDTLRSYALTQSLQRLDAALQHNETPSVQPARR